MLTDPFKNENPEALKMVSEIKTFNILEQTLSKLVRAGWMNTVGYLSHYSYITISCWIRKKFVPSIHFDKPQNIYKIFLSEQESTWFWNIWGKWIPDVNIQTLGCLLADLIFINKKNIKIYSMGLIIDLVYGFRKETNLWDL